MALGTPVVGGTAYSASGGTSVNVPYPTGLTANTAIFMFVGQKPSRDDRNTINTPAGWTLIDRIDRVGGYGTTLGTDTGNTSLALFRKTTVTGTETGSQTVTLADNNVTWGFMVRVGYAAGATIAVGSADGQRSTAPTVNTPFSVALTNGATATNFQSGDLALWAMCIPTDVTTPAQFSAQSITATGTTFATAVELNEPDSATGNDIGGYSAYALATAGSSTTAPTVTVTPTGTVTNVRGPIVLARIREVAGGPATQTLTQTTRFNEVNDFFAPTVTRGPVALTQTARFDEVNEFFAATIAQGGADQSLTQNARYNEVNDFFAAAITQVGPTQTLTQNARFNEVNDFFAATVTVGPVTLTQNARFSELNDFFAATVNTGPVTLTQTARFNEVNDFFAATLTQTIPAQTLTQNARFSEVNDFFAATITVGPVTLTQNARFSEVNDFFAATVTTGPVALTQTARYNELNEFYPATITIGATTLTQTSRFTNLNTFYPATATTGPFNLAQGTRFDNATTFYAATVTRGAVTLTQTARFSEVNDFYPASISIGATSLTQNSRFNATTTFYPATLSVGAFTLVQTARFNEANDFFAATLTQGAGPAQTITQNARSNNTTTFFPATIGDVPVQPALAGGSVVRPRRKFRPVILYDLPEVEVVLPDLSAKARLAGLSSTLSLGSVVAKSPDPIDARTSLAFTQIETYMRGVKAESSWNDPSDEELLFILDFALD